MQVKNQDVTPYFRKEYDKLDRRTKAKLDYVKKFLNTDTIILKYECDKSEHDGDYEYYRKLLGGVKDDSQV